MGEEGMSSNFVWRRRLFGERFFDRDTYCVLLLVPVLLKY
jgi:hypothetical protein